MFALADKLYSDGDLSGAAGVLEALTHDKHPELRAEARFRLAAVREKLGDMLGAAQALRALLAEQPDANPARLGLPNREMGDPKAARAEFARAEAVNACRQWSTRLAGVRPVARPPPPLLRPVPGRAALRGRPGGDRMKFTGTLTEANDAGGRFVECPFDARTEFGQARPPVVGTVNGTAFRSRLMVYGGKSYLGFTKAVRAAAGIEVGEVLDIELELDTLPPEVGRARRARSALADDGPARAAFDALAFTHRKEYAQWVAEAKRPETKTRRVAKTLEMLHAGVKHP